ncbi:hypothetical protein SAMD00019534_071590 [Acytostelium subglobosum LB1]|uniref:hypothetical protein n=1 Tax=Acytostelium subglobosum LB1 TaxID=1410327 RepID=UPI000644EA1C|nr:hypothetical protein SAMD00019534_071590 [Acytostelium subglobosum LB1]GAM23984.1 hypothetical protein SAMD00019534_071590 [Acytostelium subglobosum LB1]|eukprot:XP_012753020.1 hypothetical protein SAMD00019534_071590 [Acytostelium subglobosum LB1]
MTTKSSTNKREELNAHVKGAKIDEATERGWEIPNVTIKQLRDAIPAHCFERDTLRSMSYVVHDFAIAAVLGFMATYIDLIPSFAIRAVLWPLYWVCQGIVCTGLWVLGHECGHQGFSSHKIVNYSVGMVLHSFLLVPFHSWRITHSQHHKNTGHMNQDQVFVPHGREKSSLPPKSSDPTPEGPHSMFDESPIMTLLDMIKIFTVGWPIYLLTHLSGQTYSEPWTSHFNPYCALFDQKQFWDVVQSVVGIGAMISALTYASSHTDPKLPHYREGVWNFERGALLTVDRSFGKVLDYFHHHIADTHIAHHVFSTMPHYHAEEATRHLKKALGRLYLFDTTPIPQALWRSWTQCRFVEDEGDVVFYKN